MLSVVQFLYLRRFKKLIKEFKNYYEIFVSCEIEELIKRDQKGLYSKH